MLKRDFLNAWLCKYLWALCLLATLEQLKIPQGSFSWSWKWKRFRELIIIKIKTILRKSKSEKRFNSIFLKNNLFTEFFKKSPHDVFGGGKMEQKCIKIFPFLRSIRLTSAPLKHPLFSLLFFTSACHSKYQNEHEPRKNRFPFL